MLEEIDNPLLDFLRTRPKAVGEAFRTNPRYRSRHRARIAWEARLDTRSVPARLIDISRAGAALRVASPPEVSTTVRIRLVGSDATPWIEGVVLGVEPLEEGYQRVRLLFRDPCPTVFLKTAVLGGSPSVSEAKAPVTEQPL